MNQVTCKVSRRATTLTLGNNGKLYSSGKNASKHCRTAKIGSTTHGAWKYITFTN
ncbi:hypothetical protein [Streptomyces sp. NPDC127119]|uniref:hypothetical protein n=1 Tax=Streptomyces sp. NPDC127119 TaxID=3345370 RepID=UPI003640DE10